MPEGRCFETAGPGTPRDMNTLHDNSSDASTGLPVRVPMERFFTALRDVLDAPGPYVSFYLTVENDEAVEASLEAVTSASPSGQAATFGRSLIEDVRAADDAMVVGLLAADGTSFVQRYPEGPAAPLVESGSLPRLAPVIEAEQRLRHHVLAVVSDEGIDVLTFPRHGAATLHRAAPGDDSYAALLIAEAAKQTETPLVLVAAEAERAAELVSRVALDVPIETRVEPVDADAGLDEVAERAVQKVASERASEAVQRIRSWKFERSHGLTAGGVLAAIDALRSDDVRLVLVTDDADDQRQAWFGDDPTDVAIDLQNATSLDGRVGYLRPARLVDVVLRSALLRDIPISVVPNLPDETLMDGIGVVRSTKII